MAKCKKCGAPGCSGGCDEVKKPSPMSFMGGMVQQVSNVDGQQVGGMIPPQANTMGNARPVFPLPVQKQAAQMFAPEQIRFATPMLKKGCNKKKY